MAVRSRFAASLLIFAILFSRGLFAQEGTEKKPCADSQTSDDRKAMIARTHCEALSCVQKTLYFSNISQPTELQDVTNAIRVIAQIQRVQQVIGAQMIIIEGTAEQVALAEKLAAEIDTAKTRFGRFGYRIDLKIQESEGDKKLNSRLYSVVTEAHQAARLSIGRPVSPPAQNEPASEAKEPAGPRTSHSIECHILIRSENERTLELSVETEFSSDTAGEAGSSSPLLRNGMNLVVQLDKPVVIARMDDPGSDRSFTMELTATRVKERP